MKKLLPLVLILAFTLTTFVGCNGQSQSNGRIWRHPDREGNFNLNEPGIMFRLLVLSMQPWREVYRMNEDGEIELYEDFLWHEVGETRQPSPAVAALFGQPIASQDEAADLGEAILAQEQAEGNFLTVELAMVTLDLLEDIWVLSFREPGVPGWEGVVFDIALQGQTGELLRMWVGGATLDHE